MWEDRSSHRWVDRHTASARPPHTLVTTPEGLSDVVSAVEDDGGMIGIDIETTGLSHARDRLRLIQIATVKGTFVIDLFAFPDPDILLQ